MVFTKWIVLNCISRCFSHIVNLASHAILSEITALEFAVEDAEDYVPSGAKPATLQDALKWDPIATTHSLIQGVSFSFDQIMYSINIV